MVSLCLQPNERSTRSKKTIRDNRSEVAILKSHLHAALRRNLRPPPLRAPALQIHRHRIARDVRPRRFDVHTQRRRVTAQTLRADASLIDGFE